MADNTTRSRREELIGINDKFREVKHSINNSLAVIMALSELAQRNPQHYEKLINTVLSRCPEIVAQLHQFSQELSEKINALPADVPEAQG